MRWVYVVSGSGSLCMGQRKLCHDLHTVSLLAELHAEHRRSQAECEGRDVQALDLSPGFSDFRRRAERVFGGQTESGDRNGFVSWLTGFEKKDIPKKLFFWV